MGGVEKAECVQGDMYDSGRVGGEWIGVDDEDGGAAAKMGIMPNPDQGRYPFSDLAFLGTEDVQLDP